MALRRLKAAKAGSNGGKRSRGHTPEDSRRPGLHRGLEIQGWRSGQNICCNDYFAGASYLHQSFRNAERLERSLQISAPCPCSKASAFYCRLRKTKALQQI